MLLPFDEHHVHDDHYRRIHKFIYGIRYAIPSASVEKFESNILY